MMFKLNQTTKNIVIVVGWGITLASIILQRIYQAPFLNAQDYILIFIFSTLAATILADARTIILGWAGVMVVSIAIMFFCLTLPGIGGEMSEFILGFLYTGAITMIFRAIFPVAIIVEFMGSVVGGIIGEVALGHTT